MLAPVALPLTESSVHAETVAEADATASAAPADLSAMIEQMDVAASEQRLKAFIGYFDPSFTHSDGLTRRQLRQSVRYFWNRYDQLTYRTQLESWIEVSPGVYETVTTTTVSGEQNSELPGAKTLSATVRSRQKVQRQKILSQTILDEQSQIVSGEQPPAVRVNLPTTVSAGEEYFFDVIVNQPLGDRILLGAAIEEAVAPQGYLNPPQFEIQALATGGLFKIGRAPLTPSDQWISALLIQDGGMYMMSQRVTVSPAAETAAAQ
ncbi:MAG: nuclear transport factor 2 family protein [Cyanobacteria bacterium P01_F01_bin.42]